MFQEIYVVDEKEELTQKLEKLFEKDNKLKFKQIPIKDIQIISNTLPQLIIINDDNIQEQSIEVCNKIRTNEDNNMIPIIVLSSNEDKEFKMELARHYVEYYISTAMGIDYLYYRIRNIFRLLVVNRTISPLTALPGNSQIQTELRKRLIKNEDFIVLYLDLDNFKAYNDVYGFLKGDEIIKFTARTISECVNQYAKGDWFIGHIGGDDFVAVLSRETNYEVLCQEIIKKFDKNVKSFFTEEDVKRGYLKVQNRKGKMEHFPLTAISIGVVIAKKDTFTNILEIGELGAQVKHIAKKYKGSCYAIDRRRY